MRATEQKYRIPFLVLAIFVLLTGLAAALDIGRRPYDGYLAPGQEILRVTEGGPADLAGLRVGDRMERIDGTAASDMRTLLRRPRAEIGETRTIEVDRAGSRVTADLTYTGLPSREKAAAWVGIILGLCFAGFGLWAYLSAPGRSSALLAVFCLFFGVSFTGPVYFSSFALRTLFSIAITGLIIMGFAVLLHYLLSFPRPSTKPVPLWFVYGPAAAVTLFFVGLNVFQPDATATLDRIITLMIGLFIAGYFVTSLVVLLGRYRAASPAERQAHGLSLMLAGATLGFLPEIVASVVLIIAPRLILPGADYYFFALALIPITFAIATVRSARSAPAYTVPPTPGEISRATV